MKSIKIFILILIILSSFSTLTSCTSKEERCEQVAFALFKNGYINNKTYQSKGIQRACIAQWDTVCIPAVHGNCGKIKNNDDWRNCILDAKSKKEMAPCGMFYIKADKFN